jgi:hypothetical protein
MHTLRDAFVRALLIGLGLFLAGCGGGTAPQPQGQGSLVLTDAPSDDLAQFEVDVASVVLHKLSGASVSVLARTARVDFAALQDIGELVARAGLEAGVYTGLTLTLDFANAVALLHGASSPAAIVDADGQPITGRLPVDITFTASHRPLVAAGRNHLFLLDLDLDQAITVDTVANKVTFVPVISAAVDPTDPEPVAISGLLVSVDTAGSSFVLEKRTPNGQRIATFEVSAAPGTIFQISGVVTLAAQGLPALAALPPGTTRVFVQGVLDSARPRLHAAAVESGAGTFGNGQDWVAGWIVARGSGAGTDTSLSVRGRSHQIGSGTRRFHTLHTVDVQLGPTKVLRRGAGNRLDSDALNVGQYVIAFGALTGTTLDARGADGVVRMLPTSVFGIANGAASSNRLSLDLARIGPLPIGEFDFLVAGQNEADPDAFEVDVAALDTSGIVAGSRIRATGWLNPVGIVGDPAMAPIALVDHSRSAQLLVCAWTPPTAAAIGSISTTAITLDVAAADPRKVFDGFGGTVLSATPAPSVQPLLGLGIYRLVQDGAIELHFDFPSFANALSQRLASSSVARVVALGGLDSTTQVFRALVVTVVLR